MFAKLNLWKQVVLAAVTLLALAGAGVLTRAS
jgi:hypothetical protein